MFAPLTNRGIAHSVFNPEWVLARPQLPDHRTSDYNIPTISEFFSFLRLFVEVIPPFSV